MLFNLVVTGCLVDGLYFEPLAIQVQQVNVASDRLAHATAPLRIVQLSDTHIERLTQRERDTIRLVNDLDPDLILLTGDYLNLSYLNDKQSLADFRYLISQLKAAPRHLCLLGAASTVPISGILCSRGWE